MSASPSDVQQQLQQNSQTESDPKSVQELTNFIQVTLQQMQDKFQMMSDQIINRNILLQTSFFFSSSRIRI